jgi:hypothetical protein
MNKFTSYFKTVIVIAALVMTSGFSLSNVFAEEYSADVTATDEATIAQGDASDVVAVDTDSSTDSTGTPSDTSTTDDIASGNHSDMTPNDSDVTASSGNNSDVTPMDSDVTPNNGGDASDITPVDEETPVDNGDTDNGGNGGNNGNSSGGRSRNSNNGGQVLGAENFQFLTNLSYGMQNSDVMELQKRLRAEGYFVYPTDTGYFGPFTLIAVKLYQIAHFSEIGFVTGFVGPLTRAVLNVM